MKNIFTRWKESLSKPATLESGRQEGDAQEQLEKSVSRGELLKVAELFAELFIDHQERREASMRHWKWFRRFVMAVVFITIGYWFFGGILGGTTGRVEVAREAFHTLPLSGKKETAHVAFIPVDSAIDGDDFGLPGPENTTLYIRTALQLASEQEQLAAVIFYINSYGGDAVASAQGYRLIKKFREKSKIPVIAFISNHAYSGGYYLALGAEEIVIDPEASLGSIGVIMKWFSTARIGSVFGIEEVTIATGPLKSCIGQWNTLTPACRAGYERSVELAFKRFLTAMSDSRNVPFDTLLAESQMPNGRTNGGTFAAEDAVSRQMANRSESVEELFEKVASNIGKKNPDVKEVEFVRYDKKLGPLAEWTGQAKKTMGSASRLMNALADSINNRAMMRAE